MTLPDRHLDLGCGASPRNPYGRGQLCGVDLRELASTPGFDYRIANVVIDPIPFEDNSFGSVSAFDFLEHVPRLLMTADGRGTRFPFIELMSEVWRVLAPGGRFYALTPAYPEAEAFVDPTHVNIVTAQTHTYFCGDEPLARMYGFAGAFRTLSARWAKRSQAWCSTLPPKKHGPAKRLERRLQRLSRKLRGKQEFVEPPVFLWELEAVK